MLRTTRRECGGLGSLTGVSAPVSLCEAHSSYSASVLHVGLAEDLHIWVMLVVGWEEWSHWFFSLVGHHIL